MAKDVSISFEGEMSELKGSLNGMRSEITTWGDSVKAIGIAAFASWGVSKVISSATALIREAAASLIHITLEASNAQEAMSKFTVVFGEQSAAMQEWGNELASSIGRSKVEVNGFLASFQDLLVPMGLTADKATEMSKTLVALGADLGSFNNKADADVINDLQAALTGSGDVMKKYGVIVSETAVQQELLNMKLDPAIADEASKAQARLNIILRGTTAAQGDALRTADGFANMMKAIQSQVKDLSVDIGNELLPHIEAILPAVSYMAGEFGKQLQEMVQSLVDLGASLSENLDADTPAEALIGTMARLSHEVTKSLKEVELAWIKLQRLNEIATNPIDTIFDSTMTDLEKQLINLQEEVEGLRQSDSGAEANAAIAGFRKFQEERAAERKAAQEKASKDATPAAEATKALAPTFEDLGRSMKSMFDKATGMGSTPASAGNDLKQFFGNFKAGAMTLTGVLGGAFDQSVGNAGRALAGGDGDQGNGKAAKSESEFSAGFEDLGSLFKRISASAASGKTPEVKAAEKSADASEKTAEETKKVAEKTGESLKELSKIRAVLERPSIPVWG